MGANVQVCWEKFCRYWDIEARMVPVEEGLLHLTADRAVAHVTKTPSEWSRFWEARCDGSYEPVEEICAAIDKLEADTGLSVPVHVDAASGGFVAPFSQPDLVWDFKLERVQSINASGHKFGLVYQVLAGSFGAMPRLCLRT